MDDTIDSPFYYGQAQVGCCPSAISFLILSYITQLMIIATAVVLAMSLTLGTLSLMGLSQAGREERNYQSLDRACVTGITEHLRPPSGLDDNDQQQEYVENVLASDHTGALCGSHQHIASSSEQPLNLPPPRLQSTDRQTVLLCLLLIVSLLANLSSWLWWLFNKDPGRLYLELHFFCAVANYGQVSSRLGSSAWINNLLSYPSGRVIKLKLYCKRKPRLFPWYHIGADDDASMDGDSASGFSPLSGYNRHRRGEIMGEAAAIKGFPMPAPPLAPVSDDMQGECFRTPPASLRVTQCPLFPPVQHLFTAAGGDPSTLKAPVSEGDPSPGASTGSASLSGRWMAP
ncbi:unnamed protein product [Boreogadus saida]